MSNGKLLWVDDEIEMLRAHILFLEKKGYELRTVTNGTDALDACNEEDFDLILLDENMPGLSGLETLAHIKEIHPSVPVVMVTKSEEENIMDQAIGSKIADYLIKPVNPNQILLTLKKNIHKREIVNEVTQSSYQQRFGEIGMQINDSLSAEDWIEVYKRLVYWELELSEADSSMNEVLHMQKQEANQIFTKFIRKHYEAWIQNPANRPLLSPDVFKRKVFPLLDQGEKVFMLVLDNFRYDQWRVLSHELSELFTIDEELYFSILPTATQYARNALFAGLMPKQIQTMYPELWVEEEEDEGKNMNEDALIGKQMERFRRKEAYTYHKANGSAAADKLLSQFNQLQNNQLTVLVLNFIDILSHARTESKMVRELAADEAAYRSITLSWFRHSAIRDLFKALAATNCHILVTTDHGSIRVDNPCKVIGDKNTNTNLRYKLGKNLGYNPKEVYEVRDPNRLMLPSPNLSTTYIFATGSRFFTYPNNYNHYVSYYRDTFQHGGISMEEMIIPLASLRSKGRR